MQGYRSHPFCGTWVRQTLMPRLAAVCLVMAFWAETSSASSQVSLFTAAQIDAAQLSAKAKAAVDTLKSGPGADQSSLILVSINRDALTGTSVAVDVAANTRFLLQGQRSDVYNPADFSWSGSTADEKTSAFFYITPQSVAGTIRSGNDIFRLSPIDERISAVIRIDASAFPPERISVQQPAQSPRPPTEFPGTYLHEPFFPCLNGGSWNHERGRWSCSNFRRQATQIQPIYIDLLVAYTPEFSDDFTTGSRLNAFIDEAVAVTNQSFTQSGVHIVLRVVKRYQTTGVPDNTTSEASLRAFAASPEAVKGRENYQADLAVLLVKEITDNNCGMALQIGASATSAFAVTSRRCAIESFSFAHEVGHLFGARHDIGHDPSITPYPYGHGFLDVGHFRTIMAYPPVTNRVTTPRVGQWSNPNIRFQGRPTGEETTADNARVLNEAAPSISLLKPGAFAPSMFQSPVVGRFGGIGDFQLALPAPSTGILFQTRENDNGQAWSQIDTILSERLGHVDALAMVNDPGNLSVLLVARSNNNLYVASRSTIAPFDWSLGRILSHNAAGSPSLINTEDNGHRVLVVPHRDAGLIYFDHPASLHRMTQLRLFENFGFIDATTIIKVSPNEFNIGGLVVVFRTGNNLYSSLKPTGFSDWSVPEMIDIGTLRLAGNMAGATYLPIPPQLAIGQAYLFVPTTDDGLATFSLMTPKYSPPHPNVNSMPFKWVQSGQIVKDMGRIQAVSAFGSRYGNIELAIRSAEKISTCWIPPLAFPTPGGCVPVNAASRPQMQASP